MKKVLVVILSTLISMSSFAVDKDPAKWIFTDKGKKYLFSKTYLMLKEQNRLYIEGVLKLTNLKPKNTMLEISILANKQLNNISEIEVVSSTRKTLSANTDPTRAMGIKSIHKFRDESWVYDVKINIDKVTFECVGRITIYEFKTKRLEGYYPGFYVALGACKKQGQDDSHRSNVGAFLENIIDYTQPESEKDDFAEWSRSQTKG